MNGFVTRLLNVTYGTTPAARPLIAPRFAPGADVPGTGPNYVEGAVGEQGSAVQVVRGAGREISSAGDVPGAERGGHRGPPVQVFGSLSLQPEGRASESAEVRVLSPTFRSGMPDQSGVPDRSGMPDQPGETRNATALPLETQETSEQRVPGAAKVANSAAAIGPAANSDAVTEPPAAPGVERSSSSSVALHAKHVPVPHHLSETSEAAQAAHGKFTPHSGDTADGATGAAFWTASRREATEVSIISASGETAGVPPRREGTDKRQDRGRSLASRWMESQREADTRTVDISAPFVGNRPSTDARQAVRDDSNSPNVADSADVPGRPVVRVTIGRIEVKAISQPAPPSRPARSPAPRLSLDEYLASQARRGL